jgi:hypothetical protein
VNRYQQANGELHRVDTTIVQFVAVGKRQAPDNRPAWSAGKGDQRRSQERFPPAHQKEYTAARIHLRRVTFPATESVAGPELTTAETTKRTPKTGQLRPALPITKDVLDLAGDVEKVGMETLGAARAE